MKILWFTNVPVSLDEKGSGTWLGAMGEGLSATGKVELGVVSLGAVDSIRRQDCGPIRQWVINRNAKCGADGLPSTETVRQIIAVVEEYSPDLVHVWGTEFYPGLLTARGIVRKPAVLNIQGIKWRLGQDFSGGLDLWDQFRCIGVKELVTRTTIPQMRRRFLAWAPLEQEIVKGHHHVLHHTLWDGAQVQDIAPAAKLYRIDLPVRAAFAGGEGWRKESAQPGVVLTIAAYAAPFKGLHVAVRALARLRRRMPNAMLRIAGIRPMSGLRQDGYLRWLNREADRLNVRSAIEWLGPLTAECLAEEMRKASAVVVPTLSENACTSMQEAMAVGVPLVASYVGGVASIAVDEQTCLFFPPGDAAMCAYQLDRVLNDSALAQRLSAESRQVGCARTDRARIIARQLSVYREVLSVGNIREPSAA